MPELKIRKLGGAKNTVEKGEAAAERLRVEVQQVLYALMLEKKMTQKDVAEKLEVSAALVSKTLSSYSNLTLRQVARFACALGEELEIVRKDARAPVRGEWLHNTTARTVPAQAAECKIYRYAPRKDLGEAQVVVNVQAEPKTAFAESVG